MTVILTAPVEAKQPGALYSGANEAYHLASGNARKPKSGEVVTVTEGGTGLTSFTLTWAGQTTTSIPAGASAAAVQAALEALSNIAPGDLTVTGSAGGPYTIFWNGGVLKVLPTATPTGGTGTVTVANSGSTTFTGPGLSNTGVADTTVANNREFDATRGPRAKAGGTPEAGTNDNVQLVDGNESLFANGDVTPSLDAVTKTDGSPATGLPAAGGTVLRVRGFGFRLATAVQFGGTAGTSFAVLDDNRILITTPAKAAGSYTVTVVRPQGNLTKATAVTFV